MKEQLIVFTRYPEPGKTKTRLIPAVGPEKAAEIHRRMAERAIAMCEEIVKQHQNIKVSVRYAGPEKEKFREWLPRIKNFVSQGGGDLGQRMNNAFVDAFREGSKGVVIIGTDCPGLTREIVEKAFQLLKESPLVLGPARDGGYYLIGLSQPVPEIFKKIAWGTDAVLSETVAAASRLSIKHVLLETLFDVDRPEDLHLIDSMF